MQQVLAVVPQVTDTNTDAHSSLAWSRRMLDVVTALLSQYSVVCNVCLYALNVVCKRCAIMVSILIDR
jgi:hypothetical protein